MNKTMSSAAPTAPDTALAVLTATQAPREPWPQAATVVFEIDCTLAYQVDGPAGPSDG